MCSSRRPEHPPRTGNSARLCVSHDTLSFIRVDSLPTLLIPSGAWVPIRASPRGIHRHVTQSLDATQELLREEIFSHIFFWVPEIPRICGEATGGCRSFKVAPNLVRLLTHLSKLNL